MKKTFILVSSGFDEYPGDGLRLVSDKKEICDTNILHELGLNDLHLGDEIEIEANIISRLETKRTRFGQ